MPAEQAARRDPVTVSLAGKAHRAGQHADIAAERKAAAVFAGAAAVADELIALDADGKALLHRFDGSIHEAGQMAVLPIGSVGIGAAAVPAALNVREDERCRRLRIAAAEGAGGDLGMTAGDHPIRQRGSKRAQHRFHNLLRAVGACRHRAGRHRINDCGGPGYDLDRAVAAGIGRHVRIHQRDHDVVDRGISVGDGRVGVALGLRIRSGQIDNRAITIDRDFDTDADRSIVDAVIIDEIVRLVGAGGNVSQSLAHAPFGVVEQLAAGVLHDGFAVFPKQAVDAIDADHQRGDLGADIAQSLVGQADLIGDDPEQLLVFNAALEKLDHRQAQAFEINLAYAASHSARCRAAEIRMMRNVAGKSDQLAGVKRRPNGIKVHHVLTAAIGVVGHNDIARRKVLRRKLIHQLAHGDFETRKQARRMMRLGDRRSGSIGDDA